MSTSVYLVSSDEITTEDALAFFYDMQAINIDKNTARGQIVEGDANIWINFIGSSLLKESDHEEIDAWVNCLGAYPYSFFEMTIGKGTGSMELAVKVARKCMQRWRVVLDDLYDSVYREENLHEILEL